jgi:hypothetical protein
MFDGIDLNDRFWRSRFGQASSHTDEAASEAGGSTQRMDTCIAFSTVKMVLNRKGSQGLEIASNFQRQFFDANLRTQQ